MHSDRTKKFKTKLQEVYSYVLGFKLSKEKAWGIFKLTWPTILEALLEDPEKKLPFAGIVGFEIQMKKPRVPPGIKSAFVKALHDSGQEKAPYLKFKLGESLRVYMTEEICGTAVAESLYLHRVKYKNKLKRRKEKRDKKKEDKTTYGHVESKEEF